MNTYMQAGGSLRTYAGGARHWQCWWLCDQLAADCHRHKGGVAALLIANRKSCISMAIHTCCTAHHSPDVAVSDAATLCKLCPLLRTSLQAVPIAVAS
jgi:hypothetical protein